MRLLEKDLFSNNSFSLPVIIYSISVWAITKCLCMMCIFFHLYSHSTSYSWAVHIYIHHRQQRHLTPIILLSELATVCYVQSVISTSSKWTPRLCLLFFMRPQISSLSLNTEGALDVCRNTALSYHSLRSRHCLPSNFLGYGAETHWRAYLGDLVEFSESHTFFLFLIIKNFFSLFLLQPNIFICALSF